MIEMCFVLMMIQLLVLLTTFHYPSSEKIQVHRLEETIKKIQFESMSKMKEYQIHIQNSMLSVNEHKIDLSPLVCETISFHYNEKGHISQANSFECHGKKISVRFVFQLGSGWMRIEE